MSNSYLDSFWLQLLPQPTLITGNQAASLVVGLGCEHFSPWIRHNWVKCKFCPPSNQRIPPLLISRWQGAILLGAGGIAESYWQPINGLRAKHWTPTNHYAIISPPPPTLIAMAAESRPHMQGDFLHVWNSQKGFITLPDFASNWWTFTDKNIL